MRSVRGLTAWLAAAVLSVVSLGASDGRNVRLIDAVKDGDRDAVRALLRQPLDVNAAEPDGTTPLLVAAQHDDLDTVQALIRAGANVRAANRYGATALTAACINGNAAMIEALLTAGADANGALPEGETALMTAARTGNVDAVKALAAHGANVNAKETWRGQTALMWAAAEDHGAVIRLLKDLGADLNARSSGGFTALLFAARGGRAEAVKALLASGANVNDTIQAARRAPAPGMGTGAGGAVLPGGLTSYYPGAAARAAAAASAPAGVPRGPAPAPNAAGGAAASNDPVAASNDPAAAQARALARILDTGFRGGNTGANGTSALVLAITNGHFDLAADLLEHGADPNAEGQGWTALHQIAWTRKLAKALLAHGADPNARQNGEPADGARNILDRLGSTPFLQAAKLGDTEYMRVLVAGGADPSLNTWEETTPMMAAAGVGIWRVGESAGTNEEALAAVKLCYELGNDVNAVNANGDTALHGAALRGSNDIAKFLVEKGAKLDVRNYTGWTPLTIAQGVMYPNTFWRSIDTAALLRQMGAKDQGQRRPQDLPPDEVAAAAAAERAQKQK
jgi:ankyrin repeat protein